MSTIYLIGLNKRLPALNNKKYPLSDSANFILMELSRQFFDYSKKSLKQKAGNR